MRTVFIIQIEEETRVFSSCEKVRTYLANHSDDFLLDQDDIDRLLEGGALRNDYADFLYGEYAVE